MRYTTVTIPSEALDNLGCYQRHVAIAGESPGVLSGSELKGKAANYGGKYAQSRETVIDLMRQYGVYDGYAPVGTNGRMSRVWVDSNNNPVTVELTEKAEA